MKALRELTFSLPRPAGGAWICFAALAAADVLFIAAHVAFRHEPLYQLNRDGGYAEMFQYAKTYAVVCLLGVLWWRWREHIYAAWMSVFAYVLLDDALRIHEQGGAAAVAILGLQPALGLRAKDFGELAVWGMFGAVFALALVLCYLRASASARRDALAIAALFAILAFFGAFVDMLHSAAQAPVLRAGLAVIEDGGEMLAMSLACAYALSLLQRATRR